jgi:uncharacterized protein (DUF2141 family)
MKKVFLSILILVFATPFLAQTGTIVVNVSGIENNKGIIRIGLYNNESTFPTYGEQFKGAEPNANTTGVSYTFTNIPAGTYAVAVWHDEDEDKTKNKNLFGAPKENYGFSRNIYGSFGPPAFEEVSFKVNSGKRTTLKIILE